MLQSLSAKGKLGSRHCALCPRRRSHSFGGAETKGASAVAFVPSSRALGGERKRKRLTTARILILSVVLIFARAPARLHRPHASASAAKLQEQNYLSSATHTVFGFPLSWGILTIRGMPLRFWFLLKFFSPSQCVAAVIVECGFG